MIVLSTSQTLYEAVSTTLSQDPGVLIGALIALGGVIFTQIIGLGILFVQLHHEREMQRKFSEERFKRDIYLGAAEGLSAMSNQFALYGDTTATGVEFRDALKARVGLLAKTHLVADDKILDALFEAHAIFQASAKELTIMRTALIAFENRYEPIIESLSQDQRRKLNSRSDRSRIDLFVQVLKREAEFGKAGARACFLMRKDLGFDSDEKWFYEWCERAFSSSADRAEEFAEELRSLSDAAIFGESPPQGS